MSRVFIVSSTPRKSGNSEILAEEFARGAQDAGHKVEKIELRGMDLKFCIGCRTCSKTGKCVLKDSVGEVLPRIQNSDILVFATPIYYYGLSGQLKTFLDRTSPLYQKENAFKKVYPLPRTPKKLLWTELSRDYRAGSIVLKAFGLQVS